MTYVSEKFFNWYEVSYDKLLTELRNNPGEHVFLLKSLINNIYILYINFYYVIFN